MDQYSAARSSFRSACGQLRCIVAAIAVLVVVAGTVTTVVMLKGTSAPAKRLRHPKAALEHRTPSTFPGLDGVEASWVIAENKLPGTTAWEIPPSTPLDGIEGFASLNYATVGSTVNLYVSTPSPTFRVVAYRMGWYRGTGARKVWASDRKAGKIQPTCPVTPLINMVSCDNWTPSLSLLITSAFVQGDYLFKLEGAGGQEGYIPLTIWSPRSDSTYLVVNRTFTEQGWNSYGGYSFYQGEGPCPAGSNTYPVCNRARIVSFDRPYNTGYGASDFFGNEYPLVQYLEKHGLDVTYVTDVTLDANPQIALRHKALLSLGHDETWSYNERTAAQTAQAHGVNIIFFGAAAVLRHVRLQASPLGSDREEVDYRNSAKDTLNGHANPMEVTGNTWSSPPTNWSEVPFTGELYSGYLTGSANVPFVVFDASAWIFKGTGLKNGSQLPGVIMSDVDHLGPSSTMPQDLEILGHSPIPLSMIYTNQGRWGNNTYSDMTYYTDPQSQAGVLDTGTVDWIYSMSPCPTTVVNCPARAVRKMTGNLLWLFGQGPAGAITPSSANWQTIQPPGS